MTSIKHTAYQLVILDIIDLANEARVAHATTGDPVAHERWKLLDEILGKLQTKREKLKPS